MDCLQKVEDGKIRRLMGLMPPGSGKSVFSSLVFPTHYLGRFPNSSVILASYGSELTRKFGRRARSIIKQPIYGRVFGAALSAESSAADEWALTNGSEWMAAGILTGITGNRVDGVIWDDLIKGRQEADSEVIRSKTWDAYFDDLMTRKKPHAFEVGITCMVGGTLVLMENGNTKLLKNIRPGDKILSYDNGKIVRSKILNWANKGPDNVFTITTKSGTSVTANARHPFLIKRKGKTEWVRLKDLIVGDLVLKATGVSGEESSAKNVINRLNAVVFATNITESGAGKKELGHHRAITNHVERFVSDAVTELLQKSMNFWLKLKMGFVQFVNNLQEPMIPKLGVENFALITATLAAKSEGCSAIIATTSLENGQQQKFCSLPPNMYEIIPDEILSIKEAGFEDVFDIEVEYTENFIANGLISHNTRWHEDDPAGRILPANYNGESGWVKGRDGNDWYVVCLPAECERADDPLGRAPGDILWPEWFTKEHFAPFKLNARTWNSLFQQRPAPESGDYFQADWLKFYGPGQIHKCPPRDELTLYGASDYAVTQEGGDYTVHIIVGIDKQDNIYLIDLWRGQVTPDVWIEKVCDMIAMYRPAGWAEETGQIKSSVGPFLTKRLRERRLYIVRAQFPSRSDKAVRAQSIRGRMSMNSLYVDPTKPWFPAFKAELMLFPNGKNDDQVDALGLIGQVLDKMVPGSGPKPEPEKPKVFSTDPSTCTVTMDDLWTANERRSRSGRTLRIH
jgi:predicted phage terminase large subunit-like protein